MSRLRAVEQGSDRAQPFQGTSELLKRDGTPGAFRHMGRRKAIGAEKTNLQPDPAASGSHCSCAVFRRVQVICGRSAAKKKGAAFTSRSLSVEQQYQKPI
jgi:hypothetical protein